MSSREVLCTDFEGNDESRIDNLRVIADYIRRDAFEVVRTAQNGHLGGSSSSVELLTALYFGGQFKFDLDDPDHPNRDRVLIRGHEGPVRYPIFSLLGYINREELWTYRRLGSRLQGHEDMHETPGVDITPSGSLGMLLSFGVGASIAAKNQGSDGRTIVFLGDGEEQEGNVSEAARHASSIGLDNLICVIDKNTKQLSRPTAESDAGADLARVWSAYGWDVLEIVDGHDLNEIMTAYDKVQAIERPTLIIANTIKGKEIDGSKEHFSGYHTLSAMPNRQLLDVAIDRISQSLEPTLTNEIAGRLGRTLVRRPVDVVESCSKTTNAAYDIRFNGSGCLNMDDGQMMYFSELSKRLQSEPSAAPLYMLTPDLMRTDLVDELGVDRFTRGYFDTGLREQHAIATAHGISIQDPTARVYVCYGDAFLYRAADQMNAAATGRSNILMTGENAGLFQAQNGKTHQSIGQPGAIMQIPEAQVFEPADVHDLYNVLSDTLTLNSGFTYVRMHRGDMDILDREESDARNTDAYVVHVPERKSQFVIAASGFMVANAIQAARILEVNDNLPTTVLNVVNQKTLNRSLPKLLVDDTPLLTVYNGNPLTLQSNMSGAILGGDDIPRPKFVTGHGFTRGTSGTVEDLMRYYKLDSAGIALTALQSLAAYRSRV